MKHLRSISRNPHPMGSDEHAAVRQYIIGELTALSLESQVQTTTAFNDQWGIPIQAGTVNNIIARLKGTTNGKAVMLASHYDSVASGPGASDDGAAVAAILETARALKEGPALRNDLVFLFTDGEEPGMLGAKAFIDEHPWAKDLGLALNFEARGSGGPSIMFETSEGNGWLIKEFAATAPSPISNSLAYEIYKSLPNNTDFTIFKNAGLPGLNFAYIGGIMRYHTALDNVNNIEERSLQHHGSYALTLARHFGQLDLSGRRESNAVYFNSLGAKLIHYPVSWVIALALCVVLLFAGVIWFGFRQKLLTFSKTALSVVVFGLSLFTASVLGTVGWLAIKQMHVRSGWVLENRSYNSGLDAWGLTLLTIALMTIWHLSLRKRLGALNLAVGAMFWWIGLLIAGSLFLPGASHLLTWPLLFAVVALGSSLAFKQSEFGRFKLFAALALCALPIIFLLAPTIYLMYLALVLGQPGVLTCLVALASGLLIIQIDLATRTKSWLLPLAAALVGLGLIVGAAVTAGFNNRYPRQSNLFYALNIDTGRAIWGSADKVLNPWTSQFIPKPERGSIADFYPSSYDGFLKAPAPVVELAAPQIVLLADKMDAGLRDVHLRITSPRLAQGISIFVDVDAEIFGAEINGKKLVTTSNPRSPVGAKYRWAVNYSALPADGIELALKFKPAQPLKITAVDRSNGLPMLSTPLQARPDDTIAAPSPYSDVTLVTKVYTF